LRGEGPYQGFRSAPGRVARCYCSNGDCWSVCWCEGDLSPRINCRLSRTWLRSSRAGCGSGSI